MAGETENLVLELLRGMRADMDGVRRDIAAVKQDVQDLRTGMSERFEAVETQLEGLRYVVVASVGSLVTDLKDHDTRIAAPVHRRLQKAHLLNATSQCTISESVVRHVRTDESSVRVGPLEGARV